MKKTILIGWDGAIPQVIEGMIKKGKLSNVAKLIKEGTFAIFKAMPMIMPIIVI